MTRDTRLRRTLQFPLAADPPPPWTWPDCFGTLSVYRHDEHLQPPARRGHLVHLYNCSAEGVVEVPYDAVVRLAVYQDDLAPLDALQPDDL